MPGCAKKALHKFQHFMPRTPAHSPSKWTQPDYGAKVQLTDPDFSPPMSKSETLTLQQVCGTFLFYGRAVDPTMVNELSCLASAQAHGTQTTVTQMVHFSNYCATHPASKIRYVASDMVLHIHSDASYLTEPGARSRSGGHFFFSDRPTLIPKVPKLNGPILSQAKIIQAVMSSAAKAEIGATFLNCKEAVPICTILARNSDIPNHHHRYKSILPLPPVLLIVLYARSDLTQWICDSIGSKIEWTKNNSTFTGLLLTLTWLITTQSITQSSITSGSAQ
jgi:hypothetical protein